MNMYDGLVRYKDGTLEVEPALAKSWTISDDGAPILFSCMGISFHDGSAIDANAAINFIGMFIKIILTISLVHFLSFFLFRN